MRLRKNNRARPPPFDPSRRRFLHVAGTAAIGALAFPHIARAAQPRIRKLIVFGVDGMDPILLKRYAEQGLLPNCRKLMEAGHYSLLRSSDPPQSPVAWSNFISGTNPGGHGIFDFIARDAATRLPFLSTARTIPPRRSLRLGALSLPLAGARVELLRKGHTLWKLLEEAGVLSTVLRAPVNFPPVPTHARTLSGLTTPDVHGSYGIFSLFTDDPQQTTRDVPGGHIERISLDGTVARCTLRGPANSFRTDGQTVEVPFAAEVNAERTMVRVAVQGKTLLLREKEWSDWTAVRFPMIAHVADASGICRFYARRLKPVLEIYVTPVDIDPADPAMPISTPAGYSRELAQRCGAFYTQGMPEDTSALMAGALDDDEYKHQAGFVRSEEKALTDLELGRFREGFLFTYFSSLDLNSHVYWRCLDPKHPLHTEELVRRHGHFLPDLYGSIDAQIGQALELADEHTLVIVCSDHGFLPFRRQFNLNSWLMDNGYARPIDRFDRDQADLFQNTDWTATRAYGLGINSLYLNLRSREPQGCVAPGAEADELRRSLARELMAVTDPATGEKVITRVCRPEEIYTGPFVNEAPDLIVCYNRNYRASWDTILGKYPRETVLDNRSPWSGDHCMDSALLPGVLLCNRRLAGDNPGLDELAPTILKAFGAPVPKEMTGQAMEAV
jgi:predicted AlkP superfamily phosphohydrolase/phosphomutase